MLEIACNCNGNSLLVRLKNKVEISLKMNLKNENYRHHKNKLYGKIVVLDRTRLYIYVPNEVYKSAVYK